LLREGYSGVFLCQASMICRGVGGGACLNGLFTTSFTGYTYFLGLSALKSGLVFTWFRAVFIMVLNGFCMDFLHDF